MNTRALSKKSLLFLNPPAPFVAIRDYYCSKTSRSNYLFPPVDFVMQSGILRDSFSLHFIDAIADRLDAQEATARIKSINPDIIFFLAGAVNHPADLDFIRTLSSPGRLLIGSGDIFLSSPRNWLTKYPFLTAISLDFTNHDILHFLMGNFQKIRRMAYRDLQGELHEVLDAKPEQQIQIGLPCHDLFRNQHYRFPFAKKARFSVFLTDFGCPFHCKFCVMSTLPYRARPNAEALIELTELHQMNVHELFWMNQTFGVNRKQTLALLDKLALFTPRFSWTTFCRPDLLDEEIVSAMKKAGCHTVIIGVESGSEEILKRYRKEYTERQISAAFSLCRKFGIRTVGTFILGLPGETVETIKKTSQLATMIGCDFASFHVAVPRAATKLRDESVLSGKIASDDYTMDQAGSYITLTPDGIDQRTLLKLKRRAVLGFYLRPRYIFGQIFQKRSLYELVNMTYQGFFLIAGDFIGRRKI